MCTGKGLAFNAMLACMTIGLLGWVANPVKHCRIPGILAGALKFANPLEMVSLKEKTVQKGIPNTKHEETHARHVAIHH